MLRNLPLSFELFSDATNKTEILQILWTIYELYFRLKCLLALQEIFKKGIYLSKQAQFLCNNGLQTQGRCLCECSLSTLFLSSLEVNQTHEVSIVLSKVVLRRRSSCGMSKYDYEEPVPKNLFHLLKFRHACPIISFRSNQS